MNDIDKAFDRVREKNAELFHGVRSDHEGHAYNIIAKEFHTAGYKQARIKMLEEFKKKIEGEIRYFGNRCSGGLQNFTLKELKKVKDE